jgi:signal transduction histidine kinase/HAMP domain-containing protein
MPWSVRTKEALIITLLTFVVVATTTVIHLSQLTRVVVEEADRQAALIARQLYAQTSRALARTRASRVDALRGDRELRGLVDASVGYSPHLVYVLVTDQTGRVIVHSERDKEGTVVTARPTLRELLAVNRIQRLYVLYTGGQTYESTLAMNLDDQPFGAIRVGVSTSLLWREVNSGVRQGIVLAGVALVVALLVALVLTAVIVRPIRQLARQVGRLRRGEASLEDPTPSGGKDELGELASQLQLLGQQLQSDRVQTLSERAHLQHVVDILEDGIIFFTPDRRILFYNKATEEVVARPLSEAIGLRLDELLPAAHPIRAVLDRAFADGADVRNATVPLMVDGQTRELLVSVFFVADVERAMGAMVLLRDLESIKTLQSLISYSAKLAALGRLTSGVAHEVKNPLNAMMIHLELVKQGLDASPGEVQHSLDVIGSEIRRLDHVVQGFLKFVRPQELSLKPVDLGALLQAAAALLEAESEKAGVRFAFELDPTCPRVAADEELMRQAFLNILLNACQAMPSGGTVTIKTEWKRGDWVAVSITDEGVGIRPADREKIFSLYYTTKPDGSGIGLSMVYRIVQMHDGVIDVDSEVGRGTTMTVRLPVRA